MSKEYEFWLGGVYEKLGAYSSKEDADRGQSPDQPLYELLSEYDGKKIRMKIEVIED